MIRRQLGNVGGLVVSFVGGVFELHGVSLANATMYQQGQHDLNAAGMGVLLATVASLLTKVCLAWLVSSARFARLLSGALLLVVAAVTVVAWLTLGT